MSFIALWNTVIIKCYLYRQSSVEYRLTVKNISNSVAYNVTVAAIIAANPGIDPNNLRVGQIICIPGTSPGRCPSGSSEYTIRAGDTYFSLARRFNVSVQAIMDANPGVNPDALQIGQIICIPRA